jgi:flagellar basal-body rod protein FlgG
LKGKNMISALSIAVSGLIAQLNKLDTVTNNLANINTTGFKKSRVNIQDQAYLNTSKGQVGLGATVSSIDRTFFQGALSNTSGPLDLVIEGDGFFQVRRPDGSTAYTRDGAFRTDGQGRLVTANGDILQPQINIPLDTTSIQISNNGTVSVMRPGLAAPQVLGQIQVVRFPNPSGLISIGTNLYGQGPNSGIPQTGIAGIGGFGAINQGLLEMSNVDTAEEMVQMMLAQRAYQVNIKSLKSADEMLESVFDILR